MYANKVKKIAAVHDLSGMGRVSLTVVIPILSSMGFQVCPLPTAVLSNHTQYPGFSFLDLTDEMPKIIGEWKKLEVQFDAIYTGYLGSPRQIQIVSDFIKDFRQPDSLIVADPVLGDNGRLYTNFDMEMVKEMRHLITKADVITPNLTEALLLLHGRECAHKIWSKISNLAEKELKEFVEETGNKLAMEYETEVVITGIDFPVKAGVQEIGNLICAGDSVQWVTAQKVGGSYSGTGDLFASVLSAGMVKGTDTVESVRKAVNFLAKGIRDAVEEETDRNEGICFEKYLYELAR